MPLSLNARQIIDKAPTSELLEREVLYRIVAQSLLSLAEREKGNVLNLAAFLESKDIHHIVDEGCLTLGMIRPRANHNKYDLPDNVAAIAIQNSIRPPLVLAKYFSVIFDEIAVELFYRGGPKERQVLSDPHNKSKGYHNRWDEFIELMTSGPATILLLYSDNSNAIQLWREQVGHWDIEKTDQPNTLRGLFGKDNYNNLLHGSDSIEAVKRELLIISSLLRRMVQK